MELSDDKVWETIQDTHTAVMVMSEKLDTHCTVSEGDRKQLNERVTTLEIEAGPVDKGFKYWSKKLAPWTAGISLLAYVIYDVWISMKHGG